MLWSEIKRLVSWRVVSVHLINKSIANSSVSMVYLSETSLLTERAYHIVHINLVQSLCSQGAVSCKTEQWTNYIYAIIGIIVPPSASRWHQVSLFL